MNAITLWQPWASLIAVGAKHHETRGWRTGYRGMLAIHAAARVPTVLDMEPLRDALELARGRRPELVPGLEALVKAHGGPRGVVVATCRLADCFQITEANTPADAIDVCAGNWEPGRWAWRLEAVVEWLDPRPVRGKQGFFHWAPPRP